MHLALKKGFGLDALPIAPSLPRFCTRAVGASFWDFGGRPRFGFSGGGGDFAVGRSFSGDIGWIFLGLSGLRLGGITEAAVAG